MDDRDRFRLLHGPYRMQRCRVGRLLRCTLRGEVRVAGISDAPIPWPQCRVGGVNGRGGILSLVICGDLEDALRTESNQAVAYWWGIWPHTVSQWRKRLGVGPVTEGTRRLKQDVFAETMDNGGREQLLASLSTPERGEKIAAAQRGRKRPSATVEKMRCASTGRQDSDASRQKMQQSQLARYGAVDSGDGRATRHHFLLRAGEAVGTGFVVRVQAAPEAGHCGLAGWAPMSRRPWHTPPHRP